MRTYMKSSVIGVAIMAWLLMTGSVVADEPVLKKITVNEIEREYAVYIPSHPTKTKADGIIVCLHGFNRNMYDFFNQYDITDVANSLNLAIVAPQALPEQNGNLYDIIDNFAYLISDQLSLNSVWGCGLGVRVALGPLNLINEELNEKLDDVNFINRAIDEVVADYDLPEENLFLLGTSMGGYMTYQYALISGERLSGIISIAGSMGLKIKNKDYSTKIPVCDFHSLTDEVVPYTGSYMQNLMQISLAMPMVDVLNYWAQTNATGAPYTEQVLNYPPSNDITVEKVTYPDPENEVIHYRFDGAPHSYFFKKDNGDCMDHVEEIMQFVQSHLVETQSSNPVIAGQKALFYPNPVYDRAYFRATSGIVTVYDITGRIVYSQSITDGQADFSPLKSGIYLIHIQSGGKTQIGKLIKK